MIDHTFIFFADLCEIYCHITQLRDSWGGCTDFFYFALKEPVVCRQLWCTTRRGYPCQISSHSKRRNVKNCQGPTREPDRKATPPIKTVPWKTGFTCFLNERVLQKAVKRSLDNSIQRRKCLQDRKLFGGKRWNIKTAKKLSFIGKWPDYSRNMNLSTQNSIARLWTKFFLTYFLPDIIMV